LHTFYDVDNFFICISCNNFVATPRNIQKHTKTMISEWFPSRPWGTISRTLHLFFLHFQ
jgi:hypothetical protein